MSVDVKYRTSSRATGGRDGRSVSADGPLDVALVTPKALGGAGGEGVNPEQLFAAGYAACFLGAMKFVAAQESKTLPADAAVTAHVGIGPRFAGGFGLTLDIEVAPPGVAKEDAEALVEKAHQVCPYSNATRGNIEVGLTLL
jgi:Ohr subfamily peroxiredoxin